MLIGLLSDTHGWLDPTLERHFKQCDEIWHAGDLGPEVANDLQRWKPLRAVFGNIDDSATQHQFPEHYRITIDGISFWMTHIGGSPPTYHPAVRSSLNTQPPDVFICGHSHLAKAYRDPEKRNMLFLNPGAAGQHGFHRMRTAMRIQIAGGKISSLELIELGLRGKLT
ncbi:MAG: metallophosphoesterase family protein [Bacteroidota bacterium]